jgi:hypothetical protein
MTIADEVRDLFQQRGGELYFGESLSILEHSLQAAGLAKQADAAPHLVVAALLHDVGHLLHGMPEDIAGRASTGGTKWPGKPGCGSGLDPKSVNRCGCTSTRKDICASSNLPMWRSFHLPQFRA